MKSVMRRIRVLEAGEVARPLLPIICLNLVHNSYLLYVNGHPLHRDPDETSTQFLIRARQSCTRSKAFVGLVTSTPPNGGENS